MLVVGTDRRWFREAAVHDRKPRLERQTAAFEDRPRDARRTAGGEQHVARAHVAEQAGAGHRGQLVHHAACWSPREISRWTHLRMISALDGRSISLRRAASMASINDFGTRTWTCMLGCVRLLIR